MSSIALPSAVPAHGIAYTTAGGTAVASLDGTVLFTIPGMSVVGRSQDASTMAVVVGDSSGTAFALTIGSATLTPPPQPPGEADNLRWTADHAPSGCLRDARRKNSALLLCALDQDGLPTSINREGVGTPAPIANTPAEQVSGGSWTDAIEGPGNAVAATWSGECESLSAYLIQPGQEPINLNPGGEGIVLAWDGSDVIFARLPDCGSPNSTAQLIRVAPDGAATRIPTDQATEVPLAW